MTMYLRLCQYGILFLMLFASSMLYAKDLGVIGQTYSIQEQDFLELIMERLHLMKQNGQWQRLEKQFSENVKTHADRPKSLTHLQRALVSHSWHYDPSLKVPYDLRDHKGRVFVRAGTTVNPLQLITIHRKMIFFNGDDKEQVVWVKKINHSLDEQTKLVLVKGSIIEQEKIFKQPIYFDQEGRLTHRFHIQHVPAMVMQEGFHLKVSEVAI